MLDSWQTLFGMPVDIRADNRFLASHAEFDDWAERRRASLRDGIFLPRDAPRTGLLMDGNKPAGGRWNFDKDNRKPAKADLLMPRPLSFAPDAITREVLALVAAALRRPPRQPRRLRLRRDRAPMRCAAGDHFLDARAAAVSAIIRTRC